MKIIFIEHPVFPGHCVPLRSVYQSKKSYFQTPAVYVPQSNSKFPNHKLFPAELSLFMFLISTFRVLHRNYEVGSFYTEEKLVLSDIMRLGLDVSCYRCSKWSKALLIFSVVSFVNEMFRFTSFSVFALSYI